MPFSLSLGIIGGADGPTAIAVSMELGSKYIGAIMVAAYSYMALVPLVQPPIIKMCTTKKERLIRMDNTAGKVPSGINLNPIMIAKPIAK